MIRTFAALLFVLSSTTFWLAARDGGGGGFRGEGMREEGLREDMPRVDDNVDAGLRSDVNVRPEGDDMANVNVRTVNGRDYDATVVGPDGFRQGYIWQNGDYVAVNCDPFVPYVAPFGAWSGWSVVTQPDYVSYPVYTTYPVETAVQVALQKLGIYQGPCVGLAASCAGAVEQYQMQNNMAVTGVITPELLTALGIQASFQ